eukprot:GDKK01011931.1.p1 GENE.GDKK01011931.1~~GDKK01011931.1.p1  ORF type:complete len:310 (+),score=32.82 GDKK01011931.1:48-977(+)
MQEIQMIDETLEVLLSLRKSIIDSISATRAVLNRTEDETRYLHHFREIISLTEQIQSPKYQSVFSWSKRVPSQKQLPDLEATPENPLLSYTNIVMDKISFDFRTVYDYICTRVSIGSFGSIPRLEILPGRAEGLAQPLGSKCTVQTSPNGPCLTVLMDQYFSIKFDFAPLQGPQGMHPLKSISILDGPRMPFDLSRNNLFKIAVHSMIVAILREGLSSPVPPNQAADVRSASPLWGCLSWLCRRPNIVDLPCMYCGLQLKPLAATHCVLPCLFWSYRIMDAESSTGSKLQCHLDCLSDHAFMVDEKIHI